MQRSMPGGHPGMHHGRVAPMNMPQGVMHQQRPMHMQPVGNGGFQPQGGPTMPQNPISGVVGGPGAPGISGRPPPPQAPAPQMIHDPRPQKMIDAMAAASGDGAGGPSRKRAYGSHHKRFDTIPVPVFSAAKDRNQKPWVSRASKANFTSQRFVMVPPPLFPDRQPRLRVPKTEGRDYDVDELFRASAAKGAEGGKRMAKKRWTRRKQGTGASGQDVAANVAKAGQARDKDAAHDEAAMMEGVDDTEDQGQGQQMNLAKRPVGRATRAASYVRGRPDAPRHPTGYDVGYVDKMRMWELMGGVFPDCVLPETVCNAKQLTAMAMSPDVPVDVDDLDVDDDEMGLLPVEDEALLRLDLRKHRSRYIIGGTHKREYMTYVERLVGTNKLVAAVPSASRDQLKEHVLPLRGRGPAAPDVKERQVLRDMETIRTEDRIEHFDAEAYHNRVEATFEAAKAFDRAVEKGDVRRVKAVYKVLPNADLAALVKGLKVEEGKNAPAKGTGKEYPLAVEDVPSVRRELKERGKQRFEERNAICIWNKANNRSGVFAGPPQRLTRPERDLAAAEHGVDAQDDMYRLPFAGVLEREVSTLPPCTFVMMLNREEGVASFQAMTPGEWGAPPRSDDADPDAVVTNDGYGEEVEVTNMSLTDTKKRPARFISLRQVHASMAEEAVREFGSSVTCVRADSDAAA